MKRFQLDLIKKDLEKKMVFLVGPRQSGKTWLAKKIAKAYNGSHQLFTLVKKIHKIPSMNQL